MAKVMGVPISDDFSRKNKEWDSFNHLSLISEIESEMGIVFSMEEVNKINSYKDLCEIVLNKNENPN